MQVEQHSSSWCESVSRPNNNRSTSHCDVQSDADPIDIHSGDFVFSRTDVALAGRGGHALDIMFVYQSRSYVNRHWGYGCEMSYESPEFSGDAIPWEDVVMEDQASTHLKFGNERFVWFRSSRRGSAP